MPLKGSGVARTWREIDRYDRGVGWIAYPEEAMQRASHAIAVDDEVWIADPVDADGLDSLLAEFGEVAGVVVLLSRHTRDAAAIANRHDVAVRIPAFFDGVAEEIDAPVERFSGELAESGLVCHRLVDNRFWQEAILYDDRDGTLVVPEALGTSEIFTSGGRPLGVHPMLRVRPPNTLGRFDPDRLLVGHGAGIHENTTAILADALDGALARTPRLVLENARKLLG